MMKEAKPDDRETIGSMTLRVETFVSKPIKNDPYSAVRWSYGALLDEFIIEQITSGARVIGFEMELTPDAANALRDSVMDNDYKY